MAHMITCPECQKHLQVPDELIGAKVQCPECQHTFTAQSDVETVSVSAKASKPPSLPVPAKKEAKWEVEDRDDDFDDDRPSKRSKRRKSLRSDFVPHRGGLILTFGIIAIVTGLGVVFGPIAWVMGNNDLKEISEGRMDPEGESMTNIGRILGMVATILSIIGIVVGCGIFIVYFCIIAMFVGAVAGAAKKNNPPFPRR
jgi:predicted Zn finger-like uncharacterized protein